MADSHRNMADLHQAMALYGVDHDVWEDLPGWGSITPRVLRQPNLLEPVLGPDYSRVVWSPAHREGWRTRRGRQNPAGTGFFWRAPSHRDRGVLFQDYSTTIEEATAREGSYAIVVDQVFDMRYFFPEEGDQQRGPVLVELQVSGAVETTRRAGVPRILFESWYQPTRSEP